MLGLAILFPLFLTPVSGWSGDVTEERWRSHCGSEANKKKTRYRS